MVEFIIAIAISLIIVGAASYVFLSQSGAVRISKSVSVEQQRLNNAFYTVKQNLRMAGFDYGGDFFRNSDLSGSILSILPVQIIPADYNGGTNPYEVLISYSSIISSNCTIASVAALGNGSATFGLPAATGSCTSSDFYKGEIINIINPTWAPDALPGSPPVTMCVTKIEGASDQIQANPGQGITVCPSNVTNAIPPKSVTGGSISIITQALFYWWDVAGYTAPLTTAGANPSPFNKQGVLYECTVQPPLPESSALSGTAPVCQAGTVIQLEDNVNNFSVVPFPGAGINPITLQPYVYILSISATSNAAITPSSPAFSVNTGYNSNLSGASPQQNGSAISGYNIVKTLNANVFLRNVYYGS